jgi:hypothetical protein
VAAARIPGRADGAQRLAAARIPAGVTATKASLWPSQVAAANRNTHEPFAGEWGIRLRGPHGQVALAGM